MRKDWLYCDAADSLRRRAVRTVLDRLHRCLVLWLAPVLCFTAEEAWLARFPSDDGSVHLQLFPDDPKDWGNPFVTMKWKVIRDRRSEITAAIEGARAAKLIGSSLQAALTLPPEMLKLMPADEWAELAIVSAVVPGDTLAVHRAPGDKCARCWRVLPEVDAARLCRRCTAVVASADIAA